MKTLWNNNEAAKYTDNSLQLRVYTSRMLGQEHDLVLHGGGNTSVKEKATNIFGETEEVLYVKGSGWDLASIEAAGFAPVKLDVLKQMAKMEQLSDTEMVKTQRSAMTDPNAPNPSVEAILHAIIPFKYVDHTHADAVVTITNTIEGEQRIRDIYGSTVLIVPYVMPGFILAKKVYEMTSSLDWSKCKGIILMNHGVFTFDDDAKASYEKMIAIVTKAEQYLEKKCKTIDTPKISPKENLLELARIRKYVSACKGSPVLAKLNTSTPSVTFSAIPDIDAIATRGPLTPDHIIRTKQIPVIINVHSEKNIADYSQAYLEYFERNTNGHLTCLDTAPRFAVWKEHGTISFGSSLKEVGIIADITLHTIAAIQKAEVLSGWKALPEKDLFDIEYWELEQAKLKKTGSSSEFQGKVALVTGAASGIGYACVEALFRQGTVVAALDINPNIKGLFNKKEILELVCDVTDENNIKECIEETVRHFGGVDIIISNAGIFTANASIEEMDTEKWHKSISLNLTSHQVLLKNAIPYLKCGIDPSVIIMGSKNVPAPGPGASAYSATKAGLTQLARVAALELGKYGIRVNVIHPNAVYDTALWTNEVLENRARHYGLTVEQYKKNNLLKTEVTSKNVAELACAMAGAIFSKTTGAQIPIDGGNERVI